MIGICEVGPRDGLQAESEPLPTGLRATMIEQLAAAGLPLIEVGSFVRADAVPAMADTDEIVAGLPASAATYAGLVLNARGYARLVASGLRRVHIVVAASEAFAERNQNGTREGLIEFAIETIAQAEEDEVETAVTIAVAFGCPFEGAVDRGVVSDIAARLANAGARTVSFADTIGVAAPRQVRTLVVGATELGCEIGVHLHNTRNTGYANAFAAVEAGVGTIDSSVGGIGGCPFAPGATGNIATEDLLYMLARDGIETGVDLDAVAKVADWLERALRRDLPGSVHRAGVGFPLQRPGADVDDPYVDSYAI